MINAERTSPAPAARRELLPIVLLGGAAGTTWAFLGLAGEIAEGDTRAFDERFLLALRDPADPSNPLGPPWLEETARDFTALGSNGVLAFFVLATILVLVLGRRRAEAATLAASAFGAVLIESLLKHWYSRPRPELVPPAARVFTSSFPSGHATMAAAVLLTVGVLLARTQHDWRQKTLIASLAASLVLLVGTSRVYLGVHWPTDVVAGWALGAGWAAVCWAVALWLRRNRNP
ncbi:phosphatase PAP2 family protein [Dankookia rubra]|uniref:Phosphatase PAP2 family protein n=1 Tax=Dankookia rubra TaxID=1442381 RepID=A0A4R5QAB5_9PROT|nr:phosphatase PAP2 family protein [Dankookia rubra]TDH59716.1 phosphatase PAP2 family protein [Dankookia rubra]